MCRCSDRGEGFGCGPQSSQVCLRWKLHTGGGRKGERLGREDKKKKSETERVREKRGKKRKSINKGAQKIHSGSR